MRLRHVLPLDKAVLFEETGLILRNLHLAVKSVLTRLLTAQLDCRRLPLYFHTLSELLAIKIGDFDTKLITFAKFDIVEVIFIRVG
jgi:hypothetical protein